MRIGPVKIKYVERPPAAVDRFTPHERVVLDQARQILLHLENPTWLARMTADYLRDLLHRDELAQEPNDA